MRRPLLLPIVICLAIATFPLSAQRRMANRREYDLFRQASSDADALKRLAALREWEASYPSSDFRRERMLLFAKAYQESGQAADSFRAVVQILQLDPGDITALVLIARIGPTLETPSQDQVTAVEDAALYILKQAPELARAATTPPVPKQPVADATGPPASDPETERLLQMIREWRRNRPIRTAADVESEFRAIAEPALAWARSSR